MSQQIEGLDQFVWRVKGCDEYKIGDTFKVEKNKPFEPLTAQDLQEIVASCFNPAAPMPKCIRVEYDTYIRLPQGDKKITPTEQ